MESKPGAYRIYDTSYGEDSPPANWYTSESDLKEGIQSYAEYVMSEFGAHPTDLCIQVEQITQYGVDIEFGAIKITIGEAQ